MKREDTSSPLTELRPVLHLWAFQLRQDASLALKSRRRVEYSLVKRALSDAAFREALLENPRATVERAVGAPLPSPLTIQVREETAEKQFLVLPAFPYDVKNPRDVEMAMGTTLAEIAHWVVENQSTPLLEIPFLTKLVERVWTDSAFLAALKESPAAALSAFLGSDFSSENVEVVEETLTSITLVIPTATSAGRDVSEDEEEVEADMLSIAACVNGTGCKCVTDKIFTCGG